MGGCPCPVAVALALMGGQWLCIFFDSGSRLSSSDTLQGHKAFLSQAYGENTTKAKGAL